MLGRRRPTRRGRLAAATPAWPTANWPAGVRRRTGVRLRDLGPMRAARREALLGLNLADRRFGYPLEMVLRAAAAGWRIAEVEVAYLPRDRASPR